MLTELPDNLEKYSESPVFNQDTVPLALQKNHRTKTGVWAKVIVTEGSIDYVIENDKEGLRTVNAGDCVIIEPQIPHHVRVTGEVSFQLEFYRKKDVG